MHRAPLFPDFQLRFAETEIGGNDGPLKLDVEFSVVPGKWNFIVDVPEGGKLDVLVAVALDIAQCRQDVHRVPDRSVRDDDVEVHRLPLHRIAVEHGRQGGALERVSRHPSLIEGGKNPGELRGQEEGPGGVYEMEVPKAGQDVGRNNIGTGTLKAPVDQGDDAVPSGQGDDVPPVHGTAGEFSQAVLFLPSQGMPGAEDEKFTFPLHAGGPPPPKRAIPFLSKP